MSNFHATIKYNNGLDGPKPKGFYLQDIGSTNRTWLRLSSEGEESGLHPLKVNDIIKIGSTVFVVQGNDISNLKNMPIINKRAANPHPNSHSNPNRSERSNGLIAQF
jgi:predicted component of type VI protein secretion system